jgi:hypothetical protein
MREVEEEIFHKRVFLFFRMRFFYSKKIKIKIDWAKAEHVPRLAGLCLRQ